MDGGRADHAGAVIGRPAGDPNQPLPQRNE
jgi:hypothetical protein